MSQELYQVMKNIRSLLLADNSELVHADLCYHITESGTSELMFKHEGSYYKIHCEEVSTMDALEIAGEVISHGVEDVLAKLQENDPDATAVIVSGNDISPAAAARDETSYGYAGREFSSYDYKIDEYLSGQEDSKSN